MGPWHDAEGGNVLERLPEYLHDLGSVFSEEESNKLPDHSNYDHEIKLMPDTQPPYGALYPMNERELAALKEYLTVNEAAGKIRRSKSAAGAPVIFVPKPNGKMRLCVDYRGLNKVTVKDRYPLPLMSELMEKLAGAKVFTKLDLKNGYNLIRMKEGEEWKTAFRTRYGLYEYLVMPFGLCNAPASFQAMMNEILSDLLDVGVIVYIDDILIYSKTEEEHKKLVRTVVERLKNHGLCGSIDKSCFHVAEVEFLGFIVGIEGIKMNQKKIEEILNWQSPASTKHVQQFLGFANFYRRFILNYSTVCKPLTELTKKEVPFLWSPECEQAFQELKRRFTSGPILVHFHSDLKTIVETDASDFALGCVLSQIQEDNSTRPVAFHSRKFKPAELNYDVHDKEMLAIVVAFREWEHMLKSVKDQIVVWTDHKNLEYFNSTKILSRRQARWSEHMAEFNYKISYRPGDKNTKADVLSRRWDYAPEGGSSKQELAFFKPGQLELGEGQGRLAACGKATIFQLPGNFISTLLEVAVSDEAYCSTRKLAKEKNGIVVKKGFSVSSEDLLLYIREKSIWIH